MIQVTRRVTNKPTDSEVNASRKEISEEAFGVFAAGGKSLWPMVLIQKATAAKRAMKMSRLQPARRRALPMKILRRADGGAVGAGSTGDGVASESIGSPRALKLVRKSIT